MTLTLKNYHLDGLNKILDVPLSGGEARKRSRFVKCLTERRQENEVNRQEILKKVCSKDEKGEPIIEVHGEGQEQVKTFKLTDEAKAQFQKEFEEMVREDFVLEINAENLEEFKLAKKLVLECGIEFSGEESKLYDEVCNAFEKAE